MSEVERDHSWAKFQTPDVEVVEEGQGGTLVTYYEHLDSSGNPTITAGTDYEIIRRCEDKKGKRKAEEEKFGKILFRLARGSGSTRHDIYIKKR